VVIKAKTVTRSHDIIMQSVPQLRKRALSFL